MQCEQTGIREERIWPAFVDLDAEAEGDALASYRAGKRKDLIAATTRELEMSKTMVVSGRLKGKARIGRPESA